MFNANKQPQNVSKIHIKYSQAVDRRQLNSINGTQMKRSILPSAYQNKSIRSINHLIEDYLLHNLTDSETLNLRQGVVSIQYMTNSTYIGQLQQGKSQEQEKGGRGVYKYANNQVYMGDWKAGLFNGLGMYSFTNGDLYQGLFYHGISTKGILYYANGNIYEGQFRDGLKHGHGLMKYSNNQQVQPFYEGTWHKDLRHGSGVYKCREFQIHGIWENDQVNGQAIMISFQDTHNNLPYWQYKGIVSGNQLVKGNIKIVYHKGIEQFQGQIYKGKLQGKGKSLQKIKHARSKSESTYIYQGTFRQNKPQGKCVLKCISALLASNTGEVIQYEGSINESISAHGEGKIQYSNCGNYEGHFNKGLKNGHGIYKFGNGDIYVGEFKNDQINGDGSYTWNNLNVSCRGVFSKDKVIHINEVIKLPQKQQGEIKDRDYSFNYLNHTQNFSRSRQLSDQRLIYQLKR